jgi:hypothetical protein
MNVLIVAPNVGLTQAYPELARVADGNSPTILDGMVDQKTLDMALNNKQYDAIHFVTHGKANLIILSGSETITTEWLLRRLRSQNQLQLILLNACSTIYMGAAIHRILQIPVVCYPAPVADDAAAYYAAELFANLRHSASINDAHLEARASMERQFDKPVLPILLNGTAMELYQYQHAVLAKFDEWDERLDDMNTKIDTVLKEPLKHNSRMFMAALGVFLLMQVLDLLIHLG